MKTIIIKRKLIINKSPQIRAFVYMKNYRTKENLTLGVYNKRCGFKTTIDQSQWYIYAIGNSFIREDVRDDREAVVSMLKEAWGDTPCYTCAIAAMYTFGVQMPKAWSKKRVRERLFSPVALRPDEGNYTYALDNRLEGIAYEDDKLISYKMANKVYSLYPMTIVSIASYRGMFDGKINDDMHKHSLFVENEMFSQLELLDIGETKCS